MKIENRTEEVIVVNSLPLRLCFSPRAIREHFEESSVVGDCSDETLLRVAELAIQDDGLYAAFHAALCCAFEEVTGIDPPE